MIVLGGFLAIVFVFGFMLLASFGQFESGRSKRRDQVNIERRSAGDDED